MELTVEELSNELYETFQANEWEFSGYGQPEREDVRQVLDTCEMHLKDKPEGTVIEVGNFSVRKGNGKYHAYILLGEFEETE